MVLKYEDLASRPSEQLAGIEERFNISLGSKEVFKPCSYFANKIYKTKTQLKTKTKTKLGLKKALTSPWAERMFSNHAHVILRMRATRIFRCSQQDDPEK